MDTRSFIQSQIRVLDTPIRLNNLYEAPEEGEEIIPQAALTKVGESVSTTVREHNRRVYPVEATSTLADQIETTWLSTFADASILTTGQDPTVPFDALDDEALNSLPTDWATERRSRDSDLETFAESQRYTQLREKLADFKRSKAEKESTVELLEELVSRIAILERPSESIQHELSTRDGELMEEISRMKLLLARSSRTLAQTR